MHKVILAVVISILLSSAASGSVIVFTENFESGAAAPQFSGVTTVVGTQGYSAFGFGSFFLHNPTNPAQITTLTLTGLQAHTSIDLDFLLATIDSWDHNTAFGPDIFNVRVDGNLVFSDFMDHVALPGFIVDTTLGFNGAFGDAATNMGVNPLFDGIAHTASTLTIEWFASGSGYQGGTDESWAIDNIVVTLNGTAVPEPSTFVVCSLVLGLGQFFRRRSREQSETTKDELQELL